MSAKRPCLSFALNPDGHIVSIAEVPSGLACNCSCPGCGDRLIARKGEVRDHHFAHAGEKECTAGFESALHLAVKAIIERTRQLLLPPCVVVESRQIWRLAEHGRLKREERITQSYTDRDPRNSVKSQHLFDSSYLTTGVGATPPRLVSFDDIRVEQHEGSLRPDLIGIVRGSSIYIEVAVTHFVNKAKLAKLRERGTAVVELDFSAHAHTPWSWDELERRLLQETDGKRWLVNRKVEAMAQADRLEREQRTLLLQRELEEQMPTHECLFDALHGQIEIVLCHMYLAVTWRMGQGGPAGRYFHDIMRERGGTFEKQHEQWRFSSAGEEEFVWMTRRLRRAFATPGGQLLLYLPPEDEDRLRGTLRKPPGF